MSSACACATAVRVASSFNGATETFARSTFTRAQTSSRRERRFKTSDEVSTQLASPVFVAGGGEVAVPVLLGEGASEATTLDSLPAQPTVMAAKMRAGIQRNITRPSYRIPEGNTELRAHPDNSASFQNEGLAESMRLFQSEAGAVTRNVRCGYLVAEFQRYLVRSEASVVSEDLRAELRSRLLQERRSLRLASNVASPGAASSFSSNGYRRSRREERTVPRCSVGIRDLVARVDPGGIA